MSAHDTPKPSTCTCAVKPESGLPHEPACPITPLRDAAIARAGELLANIRIPVKRL